MEEHCTPKGKIIQLNENVIRDHLGEMVRSTVEETLNNMLEAEANRLCNAEMRCPVNNRHVPLKRQPAVC